MADDGVRYLDRRHRREPGALYRQLLAECPVHHVADHEPPFYVVARDDDVRGVLRDVETFLSREGSGVEYQPPGVLGNSDRPDHTRQRRVLADAFTPSAMARLEPRVGAIADELFDAFAPLGRGDFVARFAGPFPAIVIAEQLGVPPSDRARFQAWSDDIVAGLAGKRLEAQAQARQEMQVYFRACLEERLKALSRAARSPGEPTLGTVVPDDVLSRMCVAAHDEGLLSMDEMSGLAGQLLVAGHETTTSLLGLLVYRLIERPWLLGQLRADRSLVVGLIEETLRFDSPAQGLFRTTTRDALVRGVTIPVGTKVQVLFAAANRDPERWEDPEDFRPDRRNVTTHVAFGHGIHFCIGAPLARMEARVFVERLVDRMDDLALDGEPEMDRPFIHRGFSRLPIRWTPR